MGVLTYALLPRIVVVLGAIVNVILPNFERCYLKSTTEMTPSAASIETPIIVASKIVGIFLMRSINELMSVAYSG